jgi:hypothetical protein
MKADHTWRYSGGVWRWRSPSGTYYRVERVIGGRWKAGINRADTFPEPLGMFQSAEEGKAACVEHYRERAAA